MGRAAASDVYRTLVVLLTREPLMALMATTVGKAAVERRMMVGTVARRMMVRTVARRTMVRTIVRRVVVMTVVATLLTVK